MSKGGDACQCDTECTAKSYFEQHTEARAEGPLYVCDDCRRGFYRMCDYETHLSTHPDENKARDCAVCGKGPFLREEDLNEHLLTHHACEFCGKMFNRKCSLREHLVCHTGEKNYVCMICRKSFSRNGALKRHLRCHTGERLHVCTFCSKAFTRNWHLKRHLQLHCRKTPRSSKMEVQ